MAKRKAVEKKGAAKKDEKAEVQEIEIGSFYSPGSALGGAFNSLLGTGINQEVDQAVYFLNKDIEAAGGEEYQALYQKLIKNKKNVDEGTFTSAGLDALKKLNDTVGRKKVKIEKPIEIKYEDKGSMTNANVINLEKAKIIKIKD